MFVIRPIQETDMKGLCDLAGVAHGLTTLPNDEKILEAKINDSLRAFSRRVRKPAGESYIFVLEDLPQKKLVGICGILSKIGGFEPYYTYQIRPEVYESKNPAVHRVIPTLHLITAHSGPTEIFGLFLNPEYRDHGLGKLLSLSRFLFMKLFPKRFEDSVISELRGVINAEGKSPFWECVGKHFFDLDFYTADFLSGTGNKQFIEDLMPDHPIYIPLLPHQVQKVIGQVHDNAAPARRLLESQGFTYKGEVDIFDAGPTVLAKTNEIQTVANSVEAKIQIVTSFAKTDALTEALVSNTKLEFRATRTWVICKNQNEVVLDADSARALELTSKDKILYYLVPAKTKV